MESNELRIGNLVIYGGSVVIMDLHEFTHFLRFPETYTPITLTEEILLKSGFEITKNDEYPFKYVINKGMRDELEIEDLNSTTCFVLSHGRRFSVVKIKHLHQLQNLYFALTGTELKIEL